MAYLSAKYVQLNDMMARVSATGNATVVDTYTATLGHDVCSATPDVAGTDQFPPLHTDDDGAYAQSRIVTSTIKGKENP